MEKERAFELLAVNENTTISIAEKNYQKLLNQCDPRKCEELGESFTAIVEKKRQNIQLAWETVRMHLERIESEKEERRRAEVLQAKTKAIQQAKLAEKKFNVKIDLPSANSQSREFIQALMSFSGWSEQRVRDFLPGKTWVSFSKINEKKATAINDVFTRMNSKVTIVDESQKFPTYETGVPANRPSSGGSSDTNWIWWILFGVFWIIIQILKGSRRR